MMISQTEELRQHTSVISAATDFSEIKPYLKRAKRYLIRYIGKKTFDAAEAHYKSSKYRNPNEAGYTALEGFKKMDSLVDHFQDALVNYAYYLYSPQGNVILDNDGYKVTWTDSQRPAQEWQIKKVERSILSTAHELIDDLMDFLEENVDDFSFWDESETIKEARSRFINSAREFSKWYNIDDSRRFFLLIRPLLDEVERKYIEPELKGRSVDIREQILDDETDISPENQQILDLIRPAEALLTMYIAFSRIPKSLMVPFDELDPNALRDAGYSALRSLEGHMKELANETLPEDEKQDPEYRPASYDKDILPNRKSFSV